MRHTLTGVWVEIKPADLIVSRCGSHPHGCVSWNSSHTSVSYNPNGHTLTGVWVEIRFINFGVCFFVSHPHGCVSWNWKVRYTAYPRRKSHPHGCVSWNVELWSEIENLLSHTLTDVWVEIVFLKPCEPSPAGHTLTGVWVEIVQWGQLRGAERVTPSRVCELKFEWQKYIVKWALSHPHGCVSWNFFTAAPILGYFAVTPSRVCELKSKYGKLTVKTQGVTPSRVCELKFCPLVLQGKFLRGHTLTGVWVEIQILRSHRQHSRRHTLTGVWVEMTIWGLSRLLQRVTPSRVCELKSEYFRCYHLFQGHTLTGVWVEIERGFYLVTIRFKSHPHGCVSWNWL